MSALRTLLNFVQSFITVRKPPSDECTDNRKRVWIRTLKAVVEHIRSAEFTEVESLPAGTVIKVTTKTGHTYTFGIVNPFTREAIVQADGKFFNIPSRCHINGSTYGGSIILNGRISRDMHLEIGLDDSPSVITTRVKNIQIVEGGEFYGLTSVPQLSTYECH